MAYYTDNEINDNSRIDDLIVGAGSVIMPGVIVDEGTSIGAMSLVRKKTEPWSIYIGNPAKKIKKSYLNKKLVMGTFNNILHPCP
ncbi:acyltransferase [Candidatus Marithrix sp. Canyon 246]|uniref:acyltransferase n=1 Tax=Candidatus Marithrix sp. Canyon 246 TaxID=1827136 RepID=UPI00084A1233|nr:hypothetical protein [Candidatus Marithrix sp. Canyon 246]